MAGTALFNLMYAHALMIILDKVITCQVPALYYTPLYKQIPKCHAGSDLLRG